MNDILDIYIMQVVDWYLFIIDTYVQKNGKRILLIQNSEFDPCSILSSFSSPFTTLNGSRNSLNSFLKYIVIWRESWLLYNEIYKRWKIQAKASPLLIHASKYSIFLSRDVNLSFKLASLDRQLRSKEFRKSAILLIEPVMTSIYSRLAQSCWICFWKSSLCGMMMMIKLMSHFWHFEIISIKKLRKTSSFVFCIYTQM